MSFIKRAKEKRSGVPQVCLSLNCKTIEDIIAEIEEYGQYADMIEWCVDATVGSENYTKEEFVHKLHMVKSFCHKKPLIIDYKKDEEVGNRIERWAMGYADYIDVDAENSEVTKLVKEARRKKTKTIISYHVFDRMLPKDEIATQFVRMEKTDGDILKIACYAKEEADTYEVLEAANAYTMLKEHKPIVAIAMGEEGQASRICAGDFGSCISYACGSEVTAPGQFNAKDLRRYLKTYYNKGK